MKCMSPLQWPASYQRTPHPSSHSKFRTSGATALRDLERGLKLLLPSRVRDTVRITANAPVSANDRFYAEDLERKGSGRGVHGVAVYWTRNGIEQVLACDKYVALSDNIRALGLCIDAMRAIERSGASQVLERVFTGFAALPSGGPSAGPAVEPPKPKRPWWSVLGWPNDPLAGGMAPHLVLVSVEAMRKSLAAKLHPDMPGGSHEAFVELEMATAEARKLCAR